MAIISIKKDKITDFFEFSKGKVKFDLVEMQSGSLQKPPPIIPPKVSPTLRSETPQQDVVALPLAEVLRPGLPIKLHPGGMEDS